MIKRTSVFFIALCFMVNINAVEISNKGETVMKATGQFDIKFETHSDDSAPAGRMSIFKEYSGGLIGRGDGQMLSKRTESGASVYSAIEEFTGEIDGKSGSFTLFHNGYMSSEKMTLTVIVVEGSGTGDFTGLTGNLSIKQENGSHYYEFEYQISSPS